jgi:hypothetical protein
MTLMFAPVFGLLAGILLGRRREAYALLAVVWYVSLAAQTIYLAKPGATDFAGHSGNATVRWPIYWLVQPPILVLAALLLLAAGGLRTRLLRKFRGADVRQSDSTLRQQA